MKVDIYIRTYEGDLEWLKYCLRSINKFANGFNEIIICIPETQRYLLDSWNLTKEKIIICKDYGKRDYLGQQVSKLYSWKDSQADYILFMDSDCIFTRPVTPEEYFKNGKPYILKTNYSKVGDAICWKKRTERFISWTLDFEYMRQMPLIYHRNTLFNLCEFQGEDFENKIFGQPGDSDFSKFSEFNLLGAYAEKYEAEKYEFIETDLPTASRLESNPLIQYWSWVPGGVDVKREEIENYLK